MSDPSIYVSNGTCYSAAGQKLDGSFIPCGNDAFGHHACCGSGDNCLADSSCFGVHGSGYGSYLTYMAGCSDPSYEDASCPRKIIDQEWIALTLCDDSDGEWAPCSQSGDPSTLQPGAYCSCTDASRTTVQVKDSTSLANICSLPGSTGGSIKFLEGNEPTTTTSPPTTETGGGSDTTGGGGATTTTRVGTTGTGAGTGTGTGAGTSTGTEADTGSGSDGTTATQTGPATTGTGTTGGSSGSGSDPSSEGSASSSLSTGAKIGIGVGAGLGGLLVLAALIGVFEYYRRKRRARALHDEAMHDGAENSTPPPTKLKKATTPPFPEVAEIGGRPAAPWSMRTEVEGRQLRHATTPPFPEADGQAVSEIGGRPAQPWRVRAELGGGQLNKAAMPPFPELEATTPAKRPSTDRGSIT